MRPDISSNYKKIKLTKVGSYFGAEVTDLNLTKKLSDELSLEIVKALAEEQFLIFKNQQITSEDQIRFAKIFGELSVHPFSPNSVEVPELIIFDNNIYL